jgi:hypothetical protein
MRPFLTRVLKLLSNTLLIVAPFSAYDDGLMMANALTFPPTKHSNASPTCDYTMQYTRRSALVSVATGVATVPMLETSLLPYRSIANAAAASFRTYQVQPDAGEKLQPKLKALSVSQLLACCPTDRIIL